VDHRSSMTASCSPEELFSWVSDLDRYPSWLTIIREVERLSVADGTDVWSVELRAKVGPFARSKQLRMVRVAHDAPHHARFERHEDDGRDHAAWVLDATVSSVDGGSQLDIHLHYSGGLWGGLLDTVLDGEVDRAKVRLAALVDQ
jgi:hypothetical protein